MKKELMLSSLLLIIATSLFIALPQSSKQNFLTGLYFFVPTHANIIARANMSACNVTLQKGWNFISFFCVEEADGAPVETFFTNLSGQYESIFAYDPIQGWKAYNPDLPSWVVLHLQRISRKEGYWLNMKNTTHFYRDSWVSGTTITLQPGWNLVGWPLNEERNISDMVANISIEIIWYYDNSQKKWYYYRNATDHTFTKFKPYGAYWIKSLALQDWTIT